MPVAVGYNLVTICFKILHEARNILTSVFTSREFYGTFCLAPLILLGFGLGQIMHIQ